MSQVEKVKLETRDQRRETNLNLQLTFMHDIKNFYLAWLTTVPILSAVESKTLITVISAIILPIVFFTIGKTADILLQIYFQNRQDRQKPER